MRLIAGILLIFTLVGCSDILPEEHHRISAKDKGVSVAIERARFLAQVTWIPIFPLECNNGVIYESGLHVQGVPYSSVKEVQTYIGHDVSMYTFLTSTLNPYSLLYTEKIDKFPYKGTNCRLYYGVVCSSAVMYALGVTIPYSTKSFIDTELFKKCERQSPEDIFLCSILLQPGHMTMVVGIERDEFGNIVSVDIFDAKQTGTSIYTLTFEQFCDRWQNNGLVQYEYKYIENNTSPVNFETDNFIHGGYNLFPKLEVCPNKGDKSSYTVNDDVIINILTNEAYESIELYMDGSLCDKSEVCSGYGQKYVYSNLEPGDYSVKLTGSGNSSSWAYFEVLDISTSVNIIGDAIDVKFNSVNAEAEFVSYNSISNGAIRANYNVSASLDEIKIPYIVDYVGNTSLRVTYKGKYGRVFYQHELLE